MRRLVLSDLHCGSGDDLLRSEQALELIAPELEWADELVILGDLFELVFASLAEAVAAARPFLALADRNVDRIIYVPGNHDHHLVALASDERRLAAVLGQPDPTAFEVAPAQRLLERLCPNTAIQTAYPLLELDGAVYTHGHYITPHVETMGWRALDRLAWHLTGERRSRQEHLTVADYEALMSPLYALMYEMANLPRGKAAQASVERWLTGVAAVARAPVHLSRQVTALAHSVLKRDSGEDLLEGAPEPDDHVIAAMERVCLNLQVPAGPVVFAHTHTPLAQARLRDGGYTFFNSGSWVWDRRTRTNPDYRQRAWPGTVLRADDGDITLRPLLEHCDEADLHAMLGTATLPARRRALRRRRSALAPAA